MHSVVPRSHSESDLKWLQSIADVVSVVIERAKVNEELQATVAELTRVDDQRRSLLAHLVKAQEEERHRIAADLHDDVVQLMTAINLRLEVVRGADGARMATGTSTPSSSWSSSRSRRLRELLFELHPPALEEHGLAAALRAQLDQFTAEHRDRGAASHRDHPRAGVRRSHGAVPDRSGGASERAQARRGGEAWLSS